MKHGKQRHSPKKPPAAPYHKSPPAAPYHKSPPAGARYISAPQLLDRYGGRSHMWLVRKLAADPKFPKPVYFGRLRFFEIAALEQYERQRAQEAA